MGENGETRLHVRISGGVADARRIAVNDLTTLANVLQTAVRGVGTVLSGGQAGLGGRKKKAIEAATELQVIAEPSPGSFQLELGLASESATPFPEIKQPHLGERALSALLAGIAGLDESTSELPEGFDPGVLKTLDRLAPVLRRGHRIELGARGPRVQRRACVDRQWLGTLERLRRQPLRAHLHLEGVLQMVDLGAHPLQCRIDRGYLPSVMCLIPNELEAEVRAALGKLVEIVGEGEFDGSDEPKRVTVERLELVTEVAGFDPERINDHAPWQQLAEEQGVGVLADPTVLGGVFPNDDEVDEFLLSLRPDPNVA
jgi:hypothetical protein